MSTTDRPMPDFAEALERHLRHAAAEAAAGRFDAPPLLAPAVAAPSAGPGPARAARGLRPGRPVAALGTLALVAILVVVLLVAGGSGPTTSRAVGAPLALKTPLVALPDRVRPGPGGLASIVIGSPATRITRGHAVPIPGGGTAYLYGDRSGQCLWAPDPLSPDPWDGGVTCVRSTQFYRFGIVLGIGTDTQGTLVAALPQGVRRPVLSRHGQTDRSLVPSSDGVVTVTAITPTTLTLFDRAGDQSVVTVATPISPTTRPVRVNPLRNELPGVTLPGTPPEPRVVPQPDLGEPAPAGFPPVDVGRRPRNVGRRGP